MFFSQKTKISFIIILFSNFLIIFPIIVFDRSVGGFQLPFSLACSQHNIRPPRATNTDLRVTIPNPFLHLLSKKEGMPHDTCTRGRYRMKVDSVVSGLEECVPVHTCPACSGSPRFSDLLLPTPIDRYFSSLPLFLIPALSLSLSQSEQFFFCSSRVSGAPPPYIPISVRVR